MSKRTLQEVPESVHGFLGLFLYDRIPEPLQYDYTGVDCDQFHLYLQQRTVRFLAADRQNRHAQKY